MADKLFWVLMCRLWSGWKRVLVLVQPETVVRWHRTGFKLYWKWLSRHRGCAGRKGVGRELRELIFRMVAENRTWGAPRIHGELTMLGFDISERTVSRWMRKAPRNPEPAKQWKAFLNNHREAIVAMDFFSVPTLTFDVLYCFFVIAHNRRRILHFNVTRRPTSEWVSQQLREAFPYDSVPGYGRLCGHTFPPPPVLIDYHLRSSFFDYDPIALPLWRGLPFAHEDRTHLKPSGNPR